MIATRSLGAKICAVPKNYNAAPVAKMSCPLCHTRKERRACPALHQTICSVCCGTKRLVDIQCPEDCQYLSSAREHPAAAVKHQQDLDLALLRPSIQTLTERQYQLFFLFQSVIARYVPQGFARLVDDDVAEAAGSMASTIETAARGVIYEHQAQSQLAQELAAAMKTLLAGIRQRGTTVYDGEISLVLRAIERGAKEIRKVQPGDDSYVALMARLLQHTRGAAAREAKEPSLIIP